MAVTVSSTMPDVQVDHSAWTLAPGPREPDAQALAIMAHHLDCFERQPTLARLATMCAGNNMIEAGRVVVTAGSSGHRDARAREATSTLTFKALPGFAIGVTRILVIEWDRIPNLYELVRDGRLSGRVVQTKLEQLCRGARGGGFGVSLAALTRGREIFMPAMATGRHPLAGTMTPPPVSFDDDGELEDYIEPVAPPAEPAHAPISAGQTLAPRSM